MAHVEPRPSPAGPWVIVADSDTERELLAYCRAEQEGSLVLDEAYYLVQGDDVIVPDSISEEGLRRVCEALEHSSASHQQATWRRQGFSLVNPSK
jgi:hypothetical protein